MVGISPGVSSKVSTHVTQTALSEDRAAWFAGFRTFYKVKLVWWLVVGGWQVSAKE